MKTRTSFLLYAYKKEKLLLFTGVGLLFLSIGLVVKIIRVFSLKELDYQMIMSIGCIWAAIFFVGSLINHLRARHNNRLN